MSYRYFKVQYGYDEDEHVSISENELKRAIYAHLTGKKVALSEGSVDGQRVIAIVPDWVRAMGWNVGYKPTSEEYGEIQSELGKAYHGVIAEAKTQVTALLKSGNLAELDTPLSLPQSRTYTQGPTALSDLLPKPNEEKTDDKNTDNRGN